MAESYEVTGTLTDPHTVRLDEALKTPTPSTRVRVVIEPIATPPRRPREEVLKEIHARQIARGHQPPTYEEVVAYVGSEREGWDDSCCETNRFPTRPYS